ncbi:hypothetical protein B0H19DRAFT_1367635, partial [Mycena capillaripes]
MTSRLLQPESWTSDFLLRHKTTSPTALQPGNVGDIVHSPSRFSSPARSASTRHTIPFAGAVDNHTHGNLHGGPWLELHQNLASYAAHRLTLFDGPISELVRLSKQWAEWDMLSSLANYRAVVEKLFGYLKDERSLDSKRVVATQIYDRLSQ